MDTVLILLLVLFYMAPVLVCVAAKILFRVSLTKLLTATLLFYFVFWICIKLILETLQSSYVEKCWSDDNDSLLCSSSGIESLVQIQNYEVLLIVLGVVAFAIIFALYLKRRA